MRNSTRRVIQGSSTALLRILSPHHVNRPRAFSPTSFILPRRSFASRRAAALADGHDQHQHQHQHNEEFTAARRWLSKLDAQTVPRHLCDISFSRSGGPGGQNVNKVNSKATLKIPLETLLPFVPRIIHPQLQSSRYVAQRSNILVIQSEESRKQAANVETCFEKLYQLLRSSAENIIPGETSQDQKERVQKLKKTENESRIKSKKMLSNKKSSRRGSRDDD